MRGKMIVIHPSGKVDVTEYRSEPPLKDLKEAVGGHIESVPGWTSTGDVPCWVICNEEGKMEGLEVNLYAQFMWLKAAPEYAPHDMLCGPVAILSGDDAFMECL